tara:strand:- start:43 stop:744 length:702 start_codon:yes stop_codon:yes gene_type:complete
MKTYKELVESLSEKKTMSLAQRKKAALRMKKLAKTSGFQKKREKKMAKMSSKEDLMKRALKAAKMKVIEKLTGMSKSEYMNKSPQEKMVIDKKVEKKSGVIKKIATKMMPALKKQDAERIQKQKAKKEETNPCWSGYVQVGMKTTSDGRKVPNCVPEETQIDEKIEGLKKKSEKSGVSYGILKKVYDRGMAAWKTGHRPGTTPQQWAFARVNSFLTGGGARKSDADLWKKHKG